jgi:hypothetical protein
MTDKTPLQLIMERLSPLVRSAIADTKLHNNKAVHIEVNLRDSSPNVEIKYGVVTSLPILDLETGLESPLKNTPRKDTFDDAIARIESDIKALLLGRRHTQSKTTVILRIREGAYMAVEPSGSEPRYFAEVKNKRNGLLVGKHKVEIR